MITKALKIDRRSFIIGTAAVGGGLALGLKIPFGAGVVRAQGGSPEITAWVVVRLDDTVVIRIARSEMGQGTLTGLAQMVAEELECDWSKVTTEYPTPGQSVARKRIWGDFSTGGSRGIRDSHQYVRQGGATARVMLVQAAADAWGVPASECNAANSVITHGPSRRTTTYGKVAEAAAKLTPPANVTLKDPKDWKLIGKPVQAATRCGQNFERADASRIPVERGRSPVERGSCASQRLQRLTRPHHRGSNHCPNLREIRDDIRAATSVSGRTATACDGGVRADSTLVGCRRCPSYTDSFAFREV